MFNSYKTSIKSMSSLENGMEGETNKKTPTWLNCVHCPGVLFSGVSEFERHIFQKHSLKEGSMVLCQYGPNGMCPALQFGDLLKAGFRYHVRKYHTTEKNDSEDWTFYSSSQNLPAVLNDPNRGKQTNFFTKTWGDHFVEKVEIYPSPYLPEITISHFETYCKRISKRHRRHYRLKENIPSKSKTLIVENTCEVPDIFYEQSLPLHDPVVFKKVFPGLCDSQEPSITIRGLQEILSTYLDVIEMKISKQVAQKSDAFFHAMLSHDTIMEQMAKAVKTVHQTRETIKSAKEKTTEIPSKLLSLTRINKNLGTVHELLKLMGTVQQTQPMIQLLLSTSDYVAALDLISSTQKVLITQLSSIQAFRHLYPQLTEMKRLINKMLTNEFQRFIVMDLNRTFDDLTDIPEKDKIISIISGILRLKELDFINTFKTEAMTSIQATIKQCVIEIISERDGTTEVILRGAASENASLFCHEGITFLEKITPNILILFKRILFLNNLIIETSQMDDYLGSEGDELWTAEELVSMEEKLKKMIFTLTDYCIERSSNLIFAKTGDVFSDFTQLSKLSDLVDTFSEECENITGHNNNSMKLAFKSFAMKNIQNLHLDRRSQLTSSLNNERWKTSDVSNELQNVITEICSIGEIPLTLSLDARGKPEGKCLIINKENFAIVAAVQLLLKILLEYCDACKQSPVIVQYLIHCMLELIRLFNSRCCQLVLGAGAIQSAGLKTISTSNLALASRSLQVILWLLPLIKARLEKLHSNELSLNNFSNIESDLISHKQEIENKICLIVSNMLCSQLSGWDAKPPVPSQTFRNISKHLVKLHEALFDILPIDQIRYIYKKVHDNFKDKLREQLIKMNIVANGSPQHGVVTSELTFYLQTLKTLRIINEHSTEDNILYDIWLN